MMNMYLRKETIDALYNAGIKPDRWADYVNEAVLEKIKRDWGDK